MPAKIPKPSIPTEQVPPIKAAHSVLAPVKDKDQTLETANSKLLFTQQEQNTSKLVGSYLERYLLAVKADGCSSSTIRNYRSDIKQFFEFVRFDEIEALRSKPKLLAFAQAQKDKGLAEASIKRKLTSLTQFKLWLKKEGLIRASEVPLAQKSVEVVTSTTEVKSEKAPKDIAKISQEKIQKVKPNSSFFQSRFLLGINILAVIIFLAGLGYFAYQQFGETLLSYAYPSTPTRGNRILSYQGRLTDTAQSPINAATEMSFKLFDADTGGTELWSSNTCTIDPDQDGIFSVNLGAGAGIGADNESCGAELGDGVFTENANVWLEVTVGSGSMQETLSPRQPIRTVAYAINAETLQGLPPAEVATANTVPVMNSSGEIVLGGSTPAIKTDSASAGLTIESKAINLITSSGSNGDITLSPDGNGQVEVSSANLLVDGYLKAAGATLSGTYAGSQLLSLQGASGQTGNYLQWLDSSSNILGVIDESGNLGLGVSSPSYKLDVSGDINLTGALRTSGNAGSNGQILTSTGSGLAWTDASTVGTNYWQRTAGSLAPINTSDSLNLGASATASATVHLAGTSGENSFINTGKLGIGTTSPSALLHLNNTSGSAGMVINAATSNNAYIDFQENGTLKGNIWLDGANDFLGINATTYNTIINKNSGNVGIGNITSPQAQLHIYNSSTASLMVDSTSTRIDWRAGTNIDAQLGRSSTSSNANILYANSKTFGTSKQWAVGLRPSNSDYHIYSDANSFEALTVQQSGNVGISNVSPSYKLDVTGDINTTTTYRIGGVDYGQYFIDGAGTSGQIWTSDGVGRGAWQDAPSSGTSYTFTNGLTESSGTAKLGGALTENTTLTLGNYNQIFDMTGTGNFDIQSSGTSKFFVQNDGKVGIGTNAPSEQLDIASGKLNFSAGTTDVSLWGSSLSASTFGELNLQSNAANTSTILRIFPKGTSAAQPSANLQLFNTDWSASQTNYESLEFRFNSNVAQLLSTKGGTGTVRPIQIATGANTGIYMNASGYTGFGTTSPIQPLHVVSAAGGFGNNSTNGAAAQFETTSTGNTAITTSWKTGSASSFDIMLFAAGASPANAVLLDQRNNAPLMFLTNNSTRMTILGGGNVGIGTTSPGYLLDTAGDINTTTTYRIGGVDYGQYFIDSAGTSGQIWTSDGSGRGAWQAAPSGGSSYTFTNGLTESSGTVKLGGALTENTTLTLGNFNQIFNMTGTGDFDIQSSGTSKFFVQNDGKVGIGTNAPGAQVDIAGTTPVLRLTNTEDKTWTLGDIMASLEFYSADNSGNFPAVATAIKSVVESTYGNSQGLAFFTNNDTSLPTEKVRITRNGYMGIGTSSPATVLDVVGSTGLRLQDVTTNNTSKRGLISGAHYSAAEENITLMTIDSTSDSNFLRFGGGPGSNQNAANYVTFFTAATNTTLDGTERMRIDNSGNVGIGTSSPSDTLHVSGSLRLTGAFKDGSNSAGTSGNVLTSTGTGTAWADLGSLSVGNADTTDSYHISGSANYLSKFNSSNDSLVNSVLYESSGNIGLGTITPSYRLTIQGSNSGTTLGTTLLTNGNFATNSFTGWTAGSNWSAATGKAVHTAGSTATLYQAVSLTSGTTYQIDLTQSSASAGSVTISVGSMFSTTVGTTDTNRTFSFTATATGSQNFVITPSSDYNGSLDDFAIRPVTGTSTAEFALLNSDGSLGWEARSGGTALNNIFIGSNSGITNTNGANNSALGYNTLSSNTSGNYNNAFGSQALKSNTYGSNNAAFGFSSLFSNVSGSTNSALGNNSLYSNTSGSSNTAIGFSSLYNNTTGYYNSALGSYSLYSNTSGQGNIAIGNNALYSNNASYNSAIGYGALYSNTSGTHNNAIGTGSLYGNTTGNANNAIGFNSLYSNTTGTSNEAFGDEALFMNTSGNGNVAFGDEALHQNNTADFNTAVGTGSLFWNNGSNNTAIGFSALGSATGANQSVALGFSAGYNNLTGTGNVFLGYEAGYNETGSNKLYIANSSTNPPLIYGDFSTARVGIGTTTPAAGLDVVKTHTSTGDFIASRVEVNRSTSGTLTLFGYRSIVNVSHTSGTLTGAQANSTQLNFTGNGGTTSYAEGLTSNASISTGAIVSNLSMIRVYSPSNSGTITHLKGLYLQDMSAGSSTNYSIYSEGGTMYHAGSVGIGTTSPGYKFDVNSGATNQVARFTGTSGSVEGIQFVGWASGMNIDPTSASKNFYFGRDNALANFIIQTGNVGIGTTNPGSLLQVGGAGSSQIAPNLSGTGNVAFAASNQLLTFGLSNASPWASWIQSQTGTGGTLPISINPLGGNVGIGTTNPSTPLHLATDLLGAFRLSSADNASYVDLGGKYGYLNIKPSSGSYGIVLRASDSDSYYANISASSSGYASFNFNNTVGTNALNINSNGNVGIGTTSLTQKFDVTGGSTILSYYLYLRDYDDQSTNVSLINRDGSYQVRGGGLAVGSYSNGGSSVGQGYLLVQNDITAGNNINATNNVNAAGTVAYSAGIELNLGGTGNRISHIDFHTDDTYTDYGFRIYRSPGANGEVQLLQRGTGRIVAQSNTGGVQLTNGATSWTSNSDIRLKNVTSYFDNAIADLMTLNPIHFTWKSDPDGKAQVGLIAQEVQQIMPEIVDTNPDGYLGVRYTEMIPLLVAGIKEQQLQIQQLNSQVATINSLEGLGNSEQPATLQLSPTDLDLATLTPDQSSELLATADISLVDAANNTITALANYASLTVGKLRAGLIAAQNIITQNLVADRVKTEQLLTSEITANSDQLTLEGNTVAIQLNDATDQDNPEATNSSKLGTLLVQNQAGEVVASLDSQGNASLSGELTVEGQTKLGSLLTQDATVSGTLAVNEIEAQSARINQIESQLASLQDLQAEKATFGQASVSGTLYSDHIEAGSISAGAIEGLQERLSAQIAATLSEPSLLASLISPVPASDTSYFDEVSQDLGATSSATTTLQNVENMDLVADSALIQSYFEVDGNALIQTLQIAQQLNIGQSISLADNYLAFTPENDADPTFYIQPSGQGRISLLAGLMTLDESGLAIINGDLKVAGSLEVAENLQAKGSLLTDLIKSSDPGSNIQVQLAQTATNSATLEESVQESQFQFVDANNNPVASVSAQGDLTLQGGLNIAQEASTTATTKSAGQATLMAGTTSIIIETTRVTDHSMIYITPLGSTKNQVLYVKAKVSENPETPENEGQFTVALDSALEEDLSFNWWIVN